MFSYMNMPIYYQNISAAGTVIYKYCTKMAQWNDFFVFFTACICVFVDSALTHQEPFYSRNLLFITISVNFLWLFFFSLLQIWTCSFFTICHYNLLFDLQFMLKPLSWPLPIFSKNALHSWYGTVTDSG